MAEWQTRMVQVHVGATPWKFESSLRHQIILRARNQIDFGLFFNQENAML